MNRNGPEPAPPVNEVRQRADRRRKALAILEETDPPERGVLRAAFTYLLPREVRVGLTVALNRTFDGLYDEGMREVPGSALVAHGTALAADLSALLAGFEEVRRDASASHLDANERRVVAKMDEVSETLLSSLGELQGLIDGLDNAGAQRGTAE